MAATTTLLGLVTPTQGTLSGTWGDTVNYGISDYVDIAIAGTLSFAGDGAITLLNTTGSASGNGITSTTAQYMVIRITGTQSVVKVITGPSYSKLYLVDHAGATSAVTFKAAGQTGVSIAVGEKAFVFFNGTDYVKIAGTTSGAAGGSNTQVQFNSSGALAGSSGLVFDGTSLGIGSSSYGDAGSITAAIGVPGTTAGGLQLWASTAQEHYIQWGDSTTGSATYAGAISYSHASDFMRFWTASTEQMRLTSTGLGIGTSSPAYKLDLYTTAQFAGRWANATRAGYLYTDSGGPGIFNTAAYGSEGMYLNAASNYIQFVTNSVETVRITSGGNVLVGSTAARGTTVGTAHLDLFNGTAPAGTLTNGVSLYSASGDLKFMNAAGDAFDVGYRNIPQNSQSADYTLTLADAGDHIFHPVGDNNARTFTIPANSSVAYPIGTAITFINMAAANVTIAITSDTMYLSSAGTTGSRTLAQYGSATAIKITSTNWLISGSGLT